MFEPFSAGYVREREQEVVDVVVTRVVGSPSLADEIVQLCEQGRAEIRISRQVRHNIDIVLRCDFGSERELVKVLSGDDRGVFQLLDSGCGVVGGAAGRMLRIVSVRGGESGADTPAFGNRNGGLDRDLLHRLVGGIKKKLLPLQYRQLLAHAGRDDAVQMSVQRCYACGNSDVELIHIPIVTSPDKGLAVGGEDHPCDVAHRSGRAMVSWDPFRRRERDRTGSDRDVELRVIDLARSIGQIGGDPNRSLPGQGQMRL